MSGEGPLLDGVQDQAAAARLVAKHLAEAIAGIPLVCPRAVVQQVAVGVIRQRPGQVAGGRRVGDRRRRVEVVGRACLGRQRAAGAVRITSSVPTGMRLATFMPCVWKSS